MKIFRDNFLFTEMFYVLKMKKEWKKRESKVSRNKNRIMFNGSHEKWVRKPFSVYAEKIFKKGKIVSENHADHIHSTLFHYRFSRADN